MKYSSNNLNEPGIAFPLSGKVGFFVRFCPNGKEVDSTVIHANDPESAIDELVEARGWNRNPNYRPSDVWVDGVM